MDWYQLEILWSGVLPEGRSRRPPRRCEDISNVAAFSAGPSPHEDCLAEEIFVDDVRGGVLEAERVKQARREEVQWCRGMGVWEAVLRKDMDAEGAKAVSLRWVDTDKGDADRPNCRSRLVVREIRRILKNLIFLVQLNSSAGCHLWKV